MMRKGMIIVLILGAFLTGCGRTAPPDTGAPETTAAVEPTRASTAITEPTEIPTEEPTEAPTEPTLEPGSRVKVSGREVTTYRRDSQDSRDFAALEDFARAAGMSLTEREGKLYREEKLLPEVETLVRRDGVYVPVLELGEALGLECYVDREQETTYLYAHPGTRNLPEGIYVPILMYHATGDDLWGIPELFVSTTDLEEQFRYLTENGYTPIFFSDLDRVGEIQKPVILSFDDGYDDNYRLLFPLAKKYGVKINIAMITDYVGGNHKLTADEIREMWDSGLVSFQSHTGSHPHLTQLSEEELDGELSRSRLELLRLTGTMPSVLIYPYGDNNEQVRQAAAQYYDMGVIMTDGRCYATGDDPYTMSRYYVSRYTTLEEFKAMVCPAGTKE